jgi:hypothetical protein
MHTQLQPQDLWRNCWTRFVKKRTSLTHRKEKRFYCEATKEGRIISICVLKLERHQPTLSAREDLLQGSFSEGETSHREGSEGRPGVDENAYTKYSSSTSSRNSRSNGTLSCILAIQTSRRHSTASTSPCCGKFSEPMGLHCRLSTPSETGIRRIKCCVHTTDC